MNNTLKTMSFKAYFRETTKNDNECHICTRKFTHIIDEHYLIAYYSFITRYQD